MHFDPAGGGLDRYFDGLLSGLTANGVPFRAGAFGESGRGTRGERRGDAGGNTAEKRKAEILRNGASDATPRRSTLDPRLSSAASRPSTLDPRPLSPDPQSLFTLGPADAPLLRRLIAVRAAMARELRGPDVLLVSHFALYAAPVLSLPRRPRHVIHFHGPWADESGVERQRGFAVRAKHWLERRVYQTGDRFITLSGAFRDVLCARYGVDPDRVDVVPGGVDVARFLPRDRGELRARLGWPADRRIILCVRRLVRRMGLETLLEAFRAVASAAPDAVLFIAGKGPIEADLRQRAAGLGLGDRVRLLGFVSDDDLPLAYAAADLSILPSEALEGFGLATLESLACGTPVLVTPIGGLPEAVGGLDAKLILADATAEAIAAGLRTAMAHPDALPTRDACRAYAVNHFSWDRIARRVGEVYGKC